MNPEPKRLWLEALRSGEYTQGREYLHRVFTNSSDGWCCLGVLCDVAIKAGLKLPVVRDEFAHFHYYYYDGEEQYLPHSVIEWAGLQDNVDMSGDVQVSRGYSLAGLNDRGDTFDKIAQVIEEQL